MEVRVGRDPQRAVELVPTRVRAVATSTWHHVGRLLARASAARKTCQRHVRRAVLNEVLSEVVLVVVILEEVIVLVGVVLDVGVRRLHVSGALATNSELPESAAAAPGAHVIVRAVPLEEPEEYSSRQRSCASALDNVCAAHEELRDSHAEIR